MDGGCFVRVYFIFYPESDSRRTDVKYVGESIGKPIRQLFDERWVSLFFQVPVDGLDEGCFWFTRHWVQS